MSAIDDAMAQLEGQIGQEIGVSSWVTVDQAMIDRFAETTFDTQWIHVDPARAAAETPLWRHHRPWLPDALAGQPLRL
ncbi:MaoC/PaaZ C-terminal domain-containing protein [Marinibacterium profundimaris]|uniref:MaoC/PaaZ C-terminal domain-containing protein n=1 Tax=Marinibacterium profundimaris TaxID=1679460 RepID=UPI0026AB5DC1